VEIVSEKIGIKMLSSSNVLVSLSEIEVCLIIAGLYTIKGKQVDESYKKTIQNLIDKVSKQTPLDNR
jgi:hypothetical protein